MIMILYYHNLRLLYHWLIGSDGEVWKYCRSIFGMSCLRLKQLQNEYFLATVGLHTTENGPQQVCCVIRSREPWFGIVFCSCPSASVFFFWREEREHNAAHASASDWMESCLTVLILYDKRFKLNIWVLRLLLIKRFRSPDPDSHLYFSEALERWKLRDGVKHWTTKSEKT